MRISAHSRDSLGWGVVLKAAAWNAYVLRRRLNAEKVCEVRVMLPVGNTRHSYTCIPQYTHSYIRSHGDSGVDSRFDTVASAQYSTLQYRPVGRK